MVVRGGASANQDGRFSKKQKKEMDKFKAPAEYSLAVDYAKVNLTPINTWVASRIKELLKGLDDEVLVGTIIESLRQETTAKDLHYELTPFLYNNTALFIKNRMRRAATGQPALQELWTLLHSATNSASGIPERFEEEERQRLQQATAAHAAQQAKFDAARERQRAPDRAAYDRRRDAPDARDRTGDVPQSRGSEARPRAHDAGAAPRDRDAWHDQRGQRDGARRHDNGTRRAADDMPAPADGGWHRRHDARPPAEPPRTHARMPPEERAQHATRRDERQPRAGHGDALQECARHKRGAAEAAEDGGGDAARRRHKHYRADSIDAPQEKAPKEHKERKRHKEHKDKERKDHKKHKKHKSSRRSLEGGVACPGSPAPHPRQRDANGCDNVSAQDGHAPLAAGTGHSPRHGRNSGTRTQQRGGGGGQEDDLDALRLQARRAKARSLSSELRKNHDLDGDGSDLELVLE